MSTHIDADVTIIVCQIFLLPLYIKLLLYIFLQYSVSYIHRIKIFSFFENLNSTWILL